MMATVIAPSIAPPTTPAASIPGWPQSLNESAVLPQRVLEPLAHRRALENGARVGGEAGRTGVAVRDEALEHQRQVGVGDGEGEGRRHGRDALGEEALGDPDQPVRGGLSRWRERPRLGAAEDGVRGALFAELAEVAANEGLDHQDAGPGRRLLGAEAQVAWRREELLEVLVDGGGSGHPEVAA